MPVPDFKADRGTFLHVAGTSLVRDGGIWRVEIECMIICAGLLPSPSKNNDDMGNRGN